MSDVFLSIVVPAFNEEARIGASLDRLSEYLGTIDREWEIVVVDDGSDDATATIVSEKASIDSRIRLIQLDESR